VAGRRGVRNIAVPPKSKRAAPRRPFLLVSMMPKLVYLDSNDFSKLSAPDNNLSQENRTILTLLRHHKRADTAQFFMSAVHLSEAVHAAEQYKDAAIRRAELMRELCGSNILHFPTELPNLELQRALRGQKDIRLSIDEITSKEGGWFGVHIPIDGLPERRTRLRQQIDTIIDAAFEKLPRRERRKWRSEFDFRKNSSHEKLRQLIAMDAQSDPIKYPFNLLDKNTLLDWLFERISDAEYCRKILQITRDPYVMFKYLLDETEIRENLYQSLRKQGRELADQMELSAQQIISALSPFATSHIEPDLDAKIENLCSGPETLRRIISSFHVSVNHVGDHELWKIVKSCPSLFVFTTANKNKFKNRAYSYLSRIRGGNVSIKEEEPSDFGDFMHCFYAPYFDVFRCDASFSGVLKSHKPVRARIAGKIGDLARMLSNDTEASREVA
jgi:hypothetical protein